MRVTIVSRIFTPEPAAASYILAACAEAFRAAGHDVTVITTKPPRGIAPADPAGITVRRAPVLRDRHGYVRGYLCYMSFDIPAFFRLLFGRRADLYLVEPPPTTGAVVRVAGMLRRTPYVYDAADLWSDAAAMVTSSRLVLRALRAVERFAIRGAAHAFAISGGLVERMREIGVATPATPIGFGVDTDVFRFAHRPRSVEPLFVYGGSYSEWHGAGIFIDAFAQLLRECPNARLLYIGNGSEREELEARCVREGLTGVEFRDPVPGAELSGILNEATASLASLKPAQGYDYAFTTKVYSSLAVGCPVVFAGVGPTVPFLEDATRTHRVGSAVPYDVDATLGAMRAAVASPLTDVEREELSAWARDSFSLAAVALAVVRGSEEVLVDPSRRGPAARAN